MHSTMKFTDAMRLACTHNKITCPGWDDGQYFFVDFETGMLKYFDGCDIENVEAAYIFIWSNWTDWEITE